MIQRIASPTPDRLHRLAATHAAAFAPLARGWSETEIANLAHTGALFADADDRGFALFSLVHDEAELLTLAVHPDHRRIGLGRALLATAEEALAIEVVTMIHLEVAADNAAAIGLYQASGYQIGRVRKDYYRRGAARVDAVTMAKQLSPKTD